MAVPPIPWQSRIRPGRSARTSAAGEIADMEEIVLAPASIYQALGGAQGVLYTGSALAAAQVPSALALVDGLALLAFPSEAAPATPLVRTVSAAASVLLGLSQPTDLVTGRRAVFHVLVTNTSGAAITLFLADQAAGRVPLYYHADHSGARPTIAAGASELFEVTYLPAPERAIVRKVALATAFRRSRPTLIGVGTPGPAENYTFAGQLAGDFLVAWDFRTAATNQAALRGGFTSLEQVGVANEFALRLSYRVAAAAGEVIPFPASNAITRCVIECWRGVDAAAPIIGSAQGSGTGIAATIPAVAASEPGLSVLGICGCNSTGPLNWLLPAGYADAGTNTGNVGSTLVKCGSRPDVIGSPAAAYTTPGAAQAWGSAALLLRGAAL